MTRKIYSPEAIEWFNPIKNIRPRPYFGDEIWPDDPRDPVFREAVSRMERFYCDKRNNRQEDLDKFRNYLSTPEQYFIVWGDVGIGKSWFLRYELLAGENSMSKTGSYHAGVIDMLGKEAEHQIFIQLRHILELYFERFCGGTQEALKEYFSFDRAKLVGKSISNLSEAERKDIQISVSKWIESRNSPSHSDAIQYVEKLLSAIQYLNRKELLIILVDNIDKTHDDDQERLLKIAVRLLRNPQIRLIIPLRKSSRLLLDRFSVLKEFTYNEMELHPLNLREMLRIRFHYSKEGTYLGRKPKITDPKNKREFTFPQIFNILFGQDEKQISDGGDFLLTMAQSNAREALTMTEKLLLSDQVKGIQNIGVPDFTIAALMLSDTTLPNPTPSCVLNLFNNEEPELPGNALIRFRVLEYFWEAENATTSDIRFQRYFSRLGYDLNRVKNVIETFLMTQLLVSLRGLSPDDIRRLEFDEIGPLKITRSGKELLRWVNRLWYFISVKRDVYLPESIIHEQDGREYCTHTDFIEWLRLMEDIEKNSIKTFTNTYGSLAPDWGLRKPHKLAAQALKVSEYQEEN